MILKTAYDSFKVETGDEAVDSEMESQLKVSKEDLVRAVNRLNLSDSIFEQVLKDRQTTHDSLMSRLKPHGER